MPRLPRRRRRPFPQLELGLTSGPPTLATPPTWDALPASARRTLRSLLTRLLVAHARGAFRTGTPEPGAMPMSAEKIGPQHRARKAVLHVRQSSTYQVQHNRESQGLQYAMRERLERSAS
jgi:hypothetical protein